MIEALKADIALKDSMLQELSKENSKLRTHPKTIHRSGRSKNLSHSFQTDQPKKVTPYRNVSFSEDEDLIQSGPASAGVVVQTKPEGNGIQFQLATTRSSIPERKDISNTGVPTKGVSNIHESQSHAQETVFPPLNQSQAVTFKLTTANNNRIKGPFLKRPVQVNATKISSSTITESKTKYPEPNTNAKLLNARSIAPDPKQWKTHRTFGQQKVMSVGNKKMTF